MAGGKETPRQKMIGMMYLVLTALLALNVSKAILDAFIAIEENIQRSNESEYYRGTAKRIELSDVAKNMENAEKAIRAKNILKVIDQIDQETGKMVIELDDLKLEILKAVGENLEKVGQGQIMLHKRDQATPLIPIKLDLNQVDGQDKYDESMRIMIGENIKKPEGNGLKMWEDLHKYKGFLCNKITNYISIDGENAFSFNTPDIRKFRNQKDLEIKLKSAFAKGKINPEDKEAVVKIYSSLSKNERYTVNEIDNVHWLGKTFDHSPVVASIASLSSLQKEILAARADAISLLFARVGGGEYTFNKIIALAYGPELVAKGEMVNVEVLMAAYDTDLQPSVTMNGSVVPNVSFGKGKIAVPANIGGEMNLKGTISITNIHGMKKSLPWTKNVKVIQPVGTISIPAFNILYRGYENILEATVTGYDQTELTGSQVALERRGNTWVAKPANATKSCSISIFGKSSLTNKIVNLGTVQYRVSRLPEPDLMLGAAKDGDRLPRGVKDIFVKFPPEVPLNAPFEIIAWELEVLNLPIPSPKGTGAELSAEALNLLQQMPPGRTVTLIAKIKNPANEVSRISATFKK